MKNTAKILKPGYMEWLPDGRVRADCSITLITGPVRVLVDTGLPGSSRAIRDALAGENLRPEDIHWVVCTHYHSDHTGGNDLFPNASFLVGHDLFKGDLYEFHDFQSGKPLEIAEGVLAVPTPGHTRYDLSLIVETDAGTVAVAGDLFFQREDLMKPKIWRTLSESPNLQVENRRRIFDRADYIIPGHGEMFATKGETRP